MSPLNDPVMIGEWLVDPRDDSIARGTERVKLEPRTMRLLMRLAQSPGQVVSLDELLESVWSGVVVGTASVYQSMSQLRKVFGDTEDPPRYIETVARKGYRLVARLAPPPAVARLGEPVSVPAPEVPAPDALPARRRTKWAALALAVVLVAAGISWWWFAHEAAPPIPPSIVVLPFNDLTPGKTEQAFCDGLTEETSNWLAQLPTLHVVARTSAFAYRDRGADVRTIGKELQTTHALEGSLRRSGNRVRITVQLIDTATGFHVWSESYDKEADDVIEVQEDIARKVADNLELRITSETDTRFAGRRSNNAEAQRLYLLAKAHAARQDGESLPRAIELFHEALKADPEFALAKVWLAHAIISERYFTSAPIEELSSQIAPLLAEVEKSSPDLVDLYVVRGQYYTELRNRELAIRDLKHALEMSPNSSTAAGKLGVYYQTLAQPREALKYYTQASSLDPRAASFEGARCQVFSDLAMYELAEAACERARALKPESAWVYSISSQLAEARGDLEVAMKWSDAALDHGTGIAAIHGERTRWLVTLGELKKAGEVYSRALAEDSQATRRDVTLTYGGSAAAVDAGGATGLRNFIRDNELDQGNVSGIYFELANASLMVDDAAQANEYVKKAMASSSFAPEDLVSPWQASGGNSYLLTAAAASRATGDTDGANRRLDELDGLLKQVANAGVETYGIHYLKAALAAMRGNDDGAMLELTRAVQLGWRDVWLADHLPYFDSLRERRDYGELIAAVRARNAETAAKVANRMTR